MSLILGLKRWAPAAAFFGGFAWDALTLGRVVAKSDLWILSGYYLGAAVLLFAIDRVHGEKWKDRIQFGLQFLFGSLFSALVVCYFRSSGSIMEWLISGVLVALLVANEFLEKHYGRTTLVRTLFCLVGCMYLNFLVPHLVHGVGTVWFLLSIALGYGMTGLLWNVSREKRTAHLVAPGGVAAVLVLAWFVGWIPPVPLVLKQSEVCRDFSRKGGTYTCTVDDQGWLVRLGIGQPRAWVGSDGRVWVLVSVFAPDGAEASVEHRWFQDSGAGWESLSTVPFAMRGGRQGGWRLYSFHTVRGEGLYRVETALQGGGVLGYSEFRIAAGNPPSAGTRTELQ